MAGVRFERVSKRFGTVEAVRDLDLTIEDGEFVVLVGPSGCGKSTTLRMLAGLDAVSEGAIFIGERRVDQLPARERDIAMVFQSYALYPHMTVGENMGFGLRLRGMARDQITQRVQQVAAALGIEPLLGRKPAALSGGQRQRVALGRAMVREPAVFLLDEPLSNLDAKLRVQTRAELTLLHERLHATFVYVTHDQVEAMTMATRIAVMNEGTLQQFGTPEEVYARPVNRFVAGFIGSPEMNFFDVPVRRMGEGLVADFGETAFPFPTAQAAALEPYEGKRVTLGMRPEHIYDAEHIPDSVAPVRLRATVDVAERLGSETLLHLRRGDEEFLARVDPGTSARAGGETVVAFDAGRAYVFDPDSGRAISG